jgi:hypothetical protein
MTDDAHNFGLIVPAAFVENDNASLYHPRAVVSVLPFGAEDAELAKGFMIKAGEGADAGKRIIEGIASTDSRDQQNEIVDQSGLDWTEFLRSGWFNDNHGKSAGDIVGYPTDVKFFAKGSVLPDGQVAPFNCHWVRGYLLAGHAPADNIWTAAMSLQRSADQTRRMGQSIEGSIVERHAADRRVVRRAKVRNVAITHCPVNADTTLSAFAKSMSALPAPDAEPLVQVDVLAILAEVSRRHPQLPVAKAVEIVDRVISDFTKGVN